MSLTEDRRKRSVDKTKEPERGKELPSGHRALVVVQLHNAAVITIFVADLADSEGRLQRARPRKLPR